MNRYIGIDIGGTKCAVVLGDEDGHIISKLTYATTSLEETLKNIEIAIDDSIKLSKSIAGSEKVDRIKAIGISCGGPLDAKAGIIKSPPNLPGWDDVHIVERFEKKYGLSVYLQNDADAGALAEWRFGAAKGYDNVIFLTFGTGLGAGLILNGSLYSGGCGMAGEIGHVRLYEENLDQLHTGYGKDGSFEGYCSGGGIAQYNYGSAKELAYKASEGDQRALDIWKQVGKDFGRCLAVLIDVLNPDIIVAGSIYTRCEELIKPSMQQVLLKETLSYNLKHCRVVASGLGDAIGDLAAICVAM